MSVAVPMSELGWRIKRIRAQLPPWPSPILGEHLRVVDGTAAELGCFSWTAGPPMQRRRALDLVTDDMLAEDGIEPLVAPPSGLRHVDIVRCLSCGGDLAGRKSRCLACSTAARMAIKRWLP